MYQLVLCLSYSFKSSSVLKSLTSKWVRYLQCSLPQIISGVICIFESNYVVLFCLIRIKGHLVLLFECCSNFFFLGSCSQWCLVNLITPTLLFLASTFIWMFLEAALGCFQKRLLPFLSKLTQIIFKYIPHP